MSGHAHQAGVCCVLRAISEDVPNYGTISGVMNTAQDRGVVAVSMHVGAYQRATTELPDLVWLAQHLSISVVVTVRTGLGLMRPKSQSTLLCRSSLSLVFQKCAQPFQLRHMCRRIFGGCNPSNAVNGITYSTAGRISRYSWLPNLRLDMYSYRRSYGGATPTTTFAYSIPSEVFPRPVQIRHWLHCATASGYGSWFNNDTHFRRVLVHPITCGVNLIA